MIRNPQLVRSGQNAMALFQQIKSKDAQQQQLTRRIPGNDAVSRNYARGFDAGGSSGLAYLGSQLELIDPSLVKPLQATTHGRDITVKTGGGFPEYISTWASNYASTGTKFFGLQGTNNTDIPEAQVDVQKGLWPTFNWAVGMTLTYIDLERMKRAQSYGEAAPFSIQELYEKSVATVWGKALDYVTYTGFLGSPGLINNPNIPAFVVPDGGGGTAWNRKQPAQILSDINQAINLTVQNSGYDMGEGCADSILIPYSQFAQLTQPMTIGGIGYNSTIEYIKRNCVAAAYGIDLKIFPLPDPWIANQGLSGSARGLVYRNDEEAVKLHVPTPCQKGMSVPTTLNGGSYQTLYFGNVSCVVFRRTTTACYMDGI